MFVFEGVVGLVAVLEVEFGCLADGLLGEVDVELVFSVLSINWLVRHKGRPNQNAFVCVSFGKVDPRLFQGDKVEFDGGAVNERNSVDAVQLCVFVTDTLYDSHIEACSWFF